MNNHHANESPCLKCMDIFDRYPGFNEELRTWFMAVQLENPDMHISCAGRGRDDQEKFFKMNLTRARYGQSAHNYNCAIDIFQLLDGKAAWEKAWFDRVVVPNLYPALKWYGAPGSAFYELPHVELTRFREMVQNGEVSLLV
jgi:hypothetical protein